MLPAADKAPSRDSSHFFGPSYGLRKNRSSDIAQKYQAFKEIQDIRNRLKLIRGMSGAEKETLDWMLKDLNESFAELISNLENHRIESMQALAVGASALKETMQEKIKELEDENRRDKMTRLLGHEEFHSQAAKYLSQASRGIYALGFIDIRDFKTLNDTKGHIIGDIAIKRVASIIGHHIRGKCRFGECRQPDAGIQSECVECSGIDLRARVGGDEFAFLMTNFQDFSEVYAVSERFNQAAFDDPILKDLNVRIDVGVVAMKFENRTAMNHNELFVKAYRQAEELMYEYKSRSKLGENPRIPVAGWKINGQIEPLFEPN